MVFPAKYRRKVFTKEIEKLKGTDEGCPMLKKDHVYVIQTVDDGYVKMKVLEIGSNTSLEWPIKVKYKFRKTTNF